jgi:hypothetical protein
MAMLTFCSVALGMIAFQGCVKKEDVDHSQHSPGCCSKKDAVTVSVTSKGVEIKEVSEVSQEPTPSFKYVVVEFNDGTTKRWEALSYREDGRSYDILGPGNVVLATIPIDRVKMVRSEN